MKETNGRFRRLGYWMASLLVVAVFAGQSWMTANTPGKAVALDAPLQVFLPILLNDYPPFRPFAIETNAVVLQDSILSQRTVQLGVGQVRLNRISWRAMQPNEASPIDWSVLASLENELRALKAANIVPHLIIDDYPAWATDNSARTDGQPTSCGPLRDDKVAAFAAFAGGVVERLSVSEFDVHVWELGNEPDVDPDLVSPNMVYGCWGDVNDTYYGGERYGRMIIAVSKVIKQKDPSAKVLIGGLLLDKPDSTISPNCASKPNCGRPELFLEGILISGAASSIDGIPYHSYPPYTNQPVDHDNHIGGPWDAWGGGYLGKARFLRQIMQRYGVSKPLYLNETALMCPETSGWCTPPTAAFFEAQANFLVRAFSRVLSENIELISWYTLESPSWRYTGLLDENNNPKPVYLAYQQLISQLDGKRYQKAVAYGSGIEAYEFSGSGQNVHVVWAVENQSLPITVQQAKFVAAYDRNGNLITPTLTANGYQLTVGFSPIYIQVK
jgi:hypothetical protein